MLIAEFLTDSVSRVHELIPPIVDNLSVEDVLWRPDGEANSIGWLVWHLLRAEDDIIADLAGHDTVWKSGGWAQRFSLPYPDDETGFSMSPEDVARFQVPHVSVLNDYAAQVLAQSKHFFSTVTETDLDRVIDTSFDPAVTMGVRLVSLTVELSQHIGQAAYLKGLRERATGTASTWKGYV